MGIRLATVGAASVALAVSSLTFAPTATAAACTPTTTTVDDQQVLTFTATTACTWEVPAGVTGLRVFIVGGGGGGGADNGSGGGGGGKTEVSELSVTAGNVLTVTAGAGGTGGVYVDGVSDTQATAGSASTVELSSTTYSAAGGSPGVTGGFDAAGGAAGTGGSGTGGMSSGGVGLAGSAGTAGFTSDITGSTVTYGGGGGGGIYVDITNRASLGPAAGGTGGGGSGSSDNGTAITNATAGTAGLGGGGGGGTAGAGLQTNGADGGSGVVIIRYGTVPSAPGVSTGSAIKIIVDNDFAVLAGNATNVTRLIYNNDYEWPTQITNAASIEVNLQAGETYIYIIPMGGGGTEDYGGLLGGLDVTGVPGAQRAVDAGALNGYLQIQGSLSGYNTSAVANGTYSVAMEDVRTGLSGATWGSAVATGAGSGVPPQYKTSGVGARETGRAWGYPDSTAVAFRYPASAVSLPPVPGDSQVKVYWSTPSSDGGFPISDYVVQYRTTAGPGSWQTFSDGTSTTTEATVTGLTNGTSYDFQIAAVNSQGQGSFSSAITAIPGTVPSAPVNVTGAPSGTQAVLNWSAPTSTGGYAITDYVVQYRTSAGPGSWNTFNDGTSTNTTATVTGLTNGTSYDFRVAAKNSRGTGDYSAPITPVWGATVPGAPLSPTSTAGNTQVVVSWAAPASNGGTPITDYIIEYRTGSASWSTFADGTSTARTATVTGLTNGTSYEFRVTAVNANGPGSASSTTTATPSAPSSGGGGSEPAPAPASTPTSSPSASPTPSPTLDPVVALAPENANPGVSLSRPLQLGSSIVSVGGEAAPATTRAVTSGSARSANTIEVASPDFQIRLASVTANGRLAPLGERDFLVIESRPLRSVRSNRTDATATLPKVRVSGFGFKPGTDVRVFLLANWYLGAVPVAANGQFSESLPVPSGIPKGAYTLQANGFTSTNLVRSVSTGVKVTQADDAVSSVKRKITVRFPALSSELTLADKRKLRRLAKRVGSETVRVSIAGYVQQSNDASNDASLSTARANAVATFLRKQDVTGQIRARGKGVASRQASARKVVITWQYRSGG